MGWDDALTALDIKCHGALPSLAPQFVSYHVHSSPLCCRRCGELLRYRWCHGVRITLHYDLFTPKPIQTDASLPKLGTTLR